MASNPALTDSAIRQRLIDFLTALFPNSAAATAGTGARCMSAGC